MVQLRNVAITKLVSSLDVDSNFKKQLEITKQRMAMKYKVMDRIW